MKPTRPTMPYEDRMSRVIAYIHDHLDEDLDLDTVADLACLSRFHWHRVYAAMTGETIAATVKRLRLQRAAYQLAQTADPIETIAQACGYRNVQSFTRIFAQTFGHPPAAYRRLGSHTQFNLASPEGQRKMYDVEIVSVPDTPLMFVEHRGAYLKISQAFERLFRAAASQDLLDGNQQMIALYYSDPHTVAEADLLSRAALTASSDRRVETPIVAMSLTGGTYARLRHKGPYADMQAAYDFLYGPWLARSGREPADLPPFEAYLNSPRDTPPTELLTDIHLPLQA